MSMPEALVTVDTIIDWFKDAVENKNPVSPATFVDAASKLNVLLGDEHEKLFSLQQEVAKKKLTDMQGQTKRNVAASQLYVETLDVYRQMKEQEAKISRVEEFIRIAKLQARMREAEYKGY